MIDRITASGKFSSPYGVSFILTSLKFKYSTISYSSFRLLTEYHSFLQKILNVSNHTLGLEFPSPYGVSFILTFKTNGVYDKPVCPFPSPYGVSFILTHNRQFHIS